MIAGTDALVTQMRGGGVFNKFMIHRIKNESPKAPMDFLNGLIYGIQETVLEPGGIIAFWRYRCLSGDITVFWRHHRPLWLERVEGIAAI
ncbi:hypothetical protein QJQ58_27310 [Paenibacillus dendritiformis]|uniref:hypothetical protein n=1 Tax=Paenibacillus dendritiformis TaxID=130049 RepID=UPI00248C3E97|nr:hypothetical protein [Paenibacillus dendritiformis]WGU94164.1 hypothetical protein QJQ58_27310 [Paenibacillus dendritiformis]